MGRLRANIARLGNPMQDCHQWKEPYVTCFPSRCLRHDKHSAELATGVATPYPAAPDFPLFRGKNKPL